MIRRKKYYPSKLDGSSAIDYIFLALLVFISAMGLWILVKGINGERAAWPLVFICILIVVGSAVAYPENKIFIKLKEKMHNILLNFKIDENRNHLSD